MMLLTAEKRYHLLPLPKSCEIYCSKKVLLKELVKKIIAIFFEDIKVSNFIYS